MLASLRTLLPSVTSEDLLFIAGLDYGQGIERHTAALRQILGSQDAVPLDGEYWYPYEVIELGAHHLEPGHERAFALCTLLVLNAVCAGYDSGTDLSTKLDATAQDYDKLPSELREAVLAAYVEATSG